VMVGDEQAVRPARRVKRIIFCMGILPRVRVILDWSGILLTAKQCVIQVVRVMFTGAGRVGPGIIASDRSNHLPGKDENTNGWSDGRFKHRIDRSGFE
jgi:hypothetical protein